MTRDLPTLPHQRDGWVGVRQSDLARWMEGHAALARENARLRSRLRRVLGEAHAWRRASWEQADVELVKGRVWSGTPGSERP